jgi:hypothetical protein
MCRISKEASKIAYKIMGRPTNMEEPKKKTKKEVSQQDRLLFEETIRLR